MSSSKEGFTMEEAEMEAPALRDVDCRFYDPQAVINHQQMVLHKQEMIQKRRLLQQLHQHHLYRLQQQFRLQKPTTPEAKKPSDADDQPVAPALPVSPSRSNLDRFVEAVSPSVQARYLSEEDAKDGVNSFFYLNDLWEYFNEWSVFGAGVPFLLNGKDNIEQYYVPSLSGMQLYADLSMQSSRVGVKESKSSEGDTKGKSVLELDRRQSMAHNKSVLSASSSATGITNPTGTLWFQFLEHEQPYNRRPLTDKVSLLASQFPELNSCRSSDLLPTSWFSVAWYPIYRIPTGPTLQDIEASFLTFHSLSTQSKCIVTSSTKISLPVFGLDSYKLKGSILNPSTPHECRQEMTLLQSAETWLRYLGVHLPDYQFFRSHSR